MEPAATWIMVMRILVGKNFSGFFNYESLFGKDNYKSNRYTLGIRIDL